jgi:hypothetical protein
MKRSTIGALIIASALILLLIRVADRAHAAQEEIGANRMDDPIVSRSGRKIHLHRSEQGEGRTRHALLQAVDEAKNVMFTIKGPGPGNGRLLEPEILDIWDEDGLASVLVRHDMTDIPQQSVPTPGARGLRYQYGWYLFDAFGGKATRQMGFETRDLPGKEGQYVCLLRERIFYDDSIAYGEDFSTRSLWEVKFKSQFEVQGTRKGKQPGQTDSESYSWTWQTFSKNGQVLRKVEDYDFFENRYFRKGQIEQFLHGLPGLQEGGKLSPNRIWGMVRCVGGIQETQALLDRFVSDPQKLETLKQLFEDGVKRFEDEEAALKAAEPERLRALVEEEKRKEEARRQRVREMDAKADKLDLELHQQALRERAREQKQREEEMAE